MSVDPQQSAVDKLEAGAREILALLDGLAYGQDTTPGLAEGRAAWEITKQSATRLSTLWQSHYESMPEGDGPHKEGAPTP